ncbi:hypothetical protein ACH4UT_28025 [Streptomyces sp. NPDC020799]|uniref:hypothetical protein n=1 Tax=Streptomyces sp. NPDC020799 TaxID=3365091 RepID=UPI0037A497AE
MMPWHLNSDQHLYTRHPEPQDWSRGETFLYEYMDFSDATLRRAIAVHEAGHAVLDMAFGIPVAEIHLCEDLGRYSGATRGDGTPDAAAWVKTGGEWRVSYMRYAAMCAAGERAQDRWMHETGLWTRERAWACERTAGNDREQIEQQLRTCRREVHFSPSPAPGVQYRTVQAVADSALSHLWDRTLRLAAAVDEHGHLTGRQAARCADLTYVAIPCDESESEEVAA